ncbi:DUF6379 domain-containing protein [Alkalihalobacillus sp. MEB130]|uniref:C-glycoside deglycosidase beta subunit domain-containing protein n=1 Tax=Alkalihalobacillus sp. MEB130 TaxID=2976704 RepID=UPI0028DFCA45|nr:DUF6379 domain-containing protein [Alkalihalobacillus sp. MEB130]MDT8860209.1 DUF6379 domain-containing protein [Alkalihalobacillus sp. MEB130]
MAVGNVFGYDTYMICEDGFSNVIENGVVIGFQLKIRIANYRGYILSQIEDIKIKVDGDEIPRKDIRFFLDDRTYTLDEMENVYDDRWEIKQIATIICLKQGGLSEGQHEITAEQHIRASYIPMIAASHSTKTLTL